MSRGKTLKFNFIRIKLGQGGRRDVWISGRSAGSAARTCDTDIKFNFFFKNIFAAAIEG